MGDSYRMYENKYPKVEEVTMVKVKSIADMGAYVSLLEYGNIEGMILLSELSRRRIRSVNKIISVGKQYPAVVVRVDEEKGYIDLSKRRLNPESGDIAKCEERFNKAKTVHSIIRHVAEVCHERVEDLYEKVGWPLYRSYGHAYDAFKLATTEPEKVLEGLDMTPEVKEVLMTNILRRMKPQAIKIRGDIEVTCFEYDGIDAIRAALKAGEAVGTEDMPIKIKLVAPPVYVILTTSLEKEKGIELLNKAIEVIKTEIAARKGNITVSEPPKAMTALDEQRFNQMMEDLQAENEEEDEEEGDGEGEGSSDEEESDEEMPAPTKGGSSSKSAGKSKRRGDD